MHPRAQARSYLKAVIEAALPGIPVHISRAREIPKGEKQSVIVYCGQETLSRCNSENDSRPGAPVIRSMSVEIIVIEASTGDGEAVADAVDKNARAIGIALNNSVPQLQPQSEIMEMVAGEDARCILTMSYNWPEYIDQMTA